MEKDHPRHDGGKRPGTTDPRLRGVSNKTINRQSYRPIETLIDRLYPSVSSISTLLDSKNFASLTVTAFKLHHNSIYNVFQYSWRQHFQLIAYINVKKFPLVEL